MKRPPPRFDVAVQGLVNETIEVAAISRLFDFVPDMIFYMKDRAGNWVTCNQRTLSFLGMVDIDGLRGKSELDLFPRSIAAPVRADDQRVLETGEIIVDKVETLIDSLGALVWARTTKLPVRAADGSIGALIGITHLLTGIGSALNSPELQPAIDFIEAHYSETVRLVYLASLTAVSPAQLRTQFHNCFGLTPHQFIMRKRMQAAADLLRGSTMPIAEIAVTCGFYDQNQFTRLFSSYYGLSPLRFRKR